MSHKTLYIDIDEEITSIVDRIRKAKADEVIIVAPKRALLMQSLINLQLLKKECARRRKKVMIVTQDRVGKKLIEKAGITVKAKAESNGDEEMIAQVPRKQTPDAWPEVDFEGAEESEREIGSSDFFEVPEALPEKPERTVRKKHETKKKTDMQGKPQLFAATERQKGEKKVEMSDIVASKKIHKTTPRSGSRSGNEQAASLRSRKSALLPAVAEQQEENARREPGFFAEREAHRQKKMEAEKFFQAAFPVFRETSPKEEKILRTARVKGKAKKYFTVFLLIFAVLTVVTAGCYFLPQASVVVELASQEKSVSKSFEASTEIVNASEQPAKIPALREETVIKREEEFEATGKKSESGRATGKVVIYNEFSAENQPLVATTRLETPDGKIFRIIKGIVVPGMTKVGSETKSGAIEVDVIADKAGDEYNIGPSNFKIPGFKGGPKYDKFLAKSEKAMAGGGQGEAASVTASDIASAREKMVAQAKKEAMEEWKSKSAGNRKFFENAVRAEVLNFSSSKTIGTEADKFTVSTSIKVQALAFSEADVKDLIVKDSGNDARRVQFFKEPNYLLAESDLEKGNLKFEVKTDVMLASEFDSSNFKRGILGKRSEEVEELMKSYPAIKKVDVRFWPFFVNRVPLNERRVDIELKS